jgi:hypothetical protein
MDVGLARMACGPDKEAEGRRFHWIVESMNKNKGWWRFTEHRCRRARSEGMNGVFGIEFLGSSSRRALLLAVLAAFQVGCCAMFGTELTPSHGTPPEASEDHEAEPDHDARSPILVEVVVDGDDADFGRFLTEKITAALSRIAKFKVVHEDADLVFRVVVSDAEEPGFEKQGPVLVRVLVVDREDDSPARLWRLESKAIVFGHFSCLKKQAVELCELFVTYLDVATRMESEMKEDVK